MKPFKALTNWVDMVAAEERRMASKNDSPPKGKAANQKDAVAPPTTN